MREMIDADRHSVRFVDAIDKRRERVVEFFSMRLSVLGCYLLTTVALSVCLASIDRLLFSSDLLPLQYVCAGGSPRQGGIATLTGSPGAGTPLLHQVLGGTGVTTPGGASKTHLCGLGEAEGALVAVQHARWVDEPPLSWLEKGEKKVMAIPSS